MCHGQAHREWDRSRLCRYSHVYRIDARDSASRSVATQLGLRMTPTYLLFDQNAHEVYRTVGQLSRPTIDAVIQEILTAK